MLTFEDSDCEEIPSKKSKEEVEVNAETTVFSEICKEFVLEKGEIEWLKEGLLGIFRFEVDEGNVFEGVEGSEGFVRDGDGVLGECVRELREYLGGDLQVEYGGEEGDVRMEEGKENGDGKSMNNEKNVDRNDGGDEGVEKDSKYSKKDKESKDDLDNEIEEMDVEVGKKSKDKYSKKVKKSKNDSDDEIEEIDAEKSPKKPKSSKKKKSKSKKSKHKKKHIDSDD